MNDDISRLMDGDLDDDAAERVLGGMKTPGAAATWTCYHAIGDSLRGECAVSPRLSRRIAAALAQEPTVLAPSRRVERPAAWAWAAAATVAAVAVVGWTAVSISDAPAEAVAFARDASGVRSESLRPQVIPTDYLLAHSDYSPSTPIQRLSPIQRAEFTQVQALPR